MATFCVPPNCNSCRKTRQTHAKGENGAYRELKGAVPAYPRRELPRQRRHRHGSGHAAAPYAPAPRIARSATQELPRRLAQNKSGISAMSHQGGPCDATGQRVEAAQQVAGEDWKRRGKLAAARKVTADQPPGSQPPASTSAASRSGTAPSAPATANENGSADGNAPCAAVQRATAMCSWISSR